MLGSRARLLQCALGNTTTVGDGCCESQSKPLSNFTAVMVTELRL